MSRLRAYDLVVGTADQARAHRPDGPAPVDVGWVGSGGPAIDPVTWRRSPRTGQPLHHCATSAQPDGYRRHGPERFSTSHVGGTFMDPSGLGRRRPSAHYLEVHRFGGLWVGDDENLVVDLDADPPFLPR
ncbi:hypothetical protein [Cellulomonas sp. URHB0016]